MIIKRSIDYIIHLSNISCWYYSCYCDWTDCLAEVAEAQHCVADNVFSDHFFSSCVEQKEWTRHFKFRTIQKL